MPDAIRVLVVDDSVVVRRLLSDGLSKDADLLVVGSAANGRVALAKLPTLKPDVITLDIEMPDMDGLTALREIRAHWPSMPVIMCSSLTERGASITLDALAAGASDYVTKPQQGSDPQAFCALLAQKVKAVVPWFEKPSASASRPLPATRATPPAPARASNGVAPASASPPLGRTGRVDVIAIGSSTGGPNALAAILPTLPADLAVPVLIVQHMPPLFTRLLAERLGRSGPLPVHEAEDGERLQPGHVYVARGDQHLALHGTRTRSVLITTDDPPENSCRPAVDVLFRSVAQIYGASALAVVLTGMGQDGLKGAEAIRAAGGQVLVQDQASSVVWGMPGFIAQAGLADAVLPLSAIGPAICSRLRGGSSGARHDGPDQEKVSCTPSS